MCRIFGRQRELSNRVYASPEARAEAQEKAEKLEMGLEPVYPTFTKPMLRPHVTGGFWLVRELVFLLNLFNNSQSTLACYLTKMLGLRLFFFSDMY